MKVLIAPDSFKECLSSQEVGAAIMAGVLRAAPHAHCEAIQISDGGEGFVAAILANKGGHERYVMVRNPLSEPVAAMWGLLQDGATAVIEVAAATGLHLLTRGQRNPFLAGSWGSGEVIRDALNAGARRFMIGLGGSASNDGGVGMLMALGLRALNAQGESIAPCAQGLRELTTLDYSGLDPRLRECDITIALDVDNPLCGEQGASAVFGPQKGAAPADVAELDGLLFHWLRLNEQVLGRELGGIPGGGAAGGLGMAFVGVLGAQGRKGIELVLELSGFDEKLKGADLVFTGEGCMDSQSLRGKAPLGVAQRAQSAGAPTIALVGALLGDATAARAMGLTAVFPIAPGAVTLDQALADAAVNLRRSAENATACFLAGRG
ncbi:glycerate kinase [Hahella aquimaris]|uniref:glycerate kinase n=1 Tax=Hahella sp. HNIBRBA332 TaxID=3015983 RepID=UPI00273C9986|nr:glycerate kinase [Hahella sp. HNIBRBA332]WLQ11996.1 glycerate kinase [Hahella sp. HNIBRBA332]